jgi:hypothetical protein
VLGDGRLMAERIRGIRAAFVRGLAPLIRGRN